MIRTDAAPGYDVAAMLILVDESIRHGRQLFGELGEVRTFDGRTVVPEFVRDAEALMVRSVTRVDAALLAGSRVRFVGTATSGTDHIDAAWLAANGVHLATAEGCNSRAVAEYVLAAILHICRLQGNEPNDRTLGVVGLGRIGTIVADWARLFGMSVLACDPPRKAAGAEGLVEFAELAGAADLVTVHVPLTDDNPHATREMVNAAWLASLRPGTTFINTSRGQIVREADLLAAMDAGHLGAAVLDVWQNEPRIDARLAERAAIATPHIAGYTHEARCRAAVMIRDQLADFLGMSVADVARPMDSASIEELTLPVAVDSPVASWIIEAAGILRIDAALRGWSARSAQNPGGFDELRARCTSRREFTACRVDASKLEESSRAILADLGFKL